MAVALVWQYIGHMLCGLGRGIQIINCFLILIEIPISDSEIDPNRFSTPAKEAWPTVK